METFLPASSCGSSIFAGAAFEPSSRLKAPAYWRGGKTRAFKKSMLLRVSLRKGGLPRLVERMAIKEGVDKDDMRAVAHTRGGDSKGGLEAATTQEGATVAVLGGDGSREQRRRLGF
jgi:hypothetical protein